MEYMRSTYDRSFPRVSIAGKQGCRAVEVTLLAQLDAGAGDGVAFTAGKRQQHHPHYNNALDEPSVRLSAPDISGNDPAALYTFAVGNNGHPFHRHAAPRLFTAISGSGGALLRFIPAGADEEDLRIGERLQHVEIPADCLFTVRMAPATWHQFQPLRGDGRHPALFAVSCHPDETAGELEADQRERVTLGSANLATLTDLLPAHLSHQLAQHEQLHAPRTTVLGFSRTMDTAWCRRLHQGMRHRIGRLRQRLGHVCLARGFVGRGSPVLHTKATAQLPEASLLRDHLPRSHHQDCIQLRVERRWLPDSSAEHLLVQLLDAFMTQPSAVISGLMRLRNIAAKPFGLRTSPLGCPVSSLISTTPLQRFSQRFPVLDSRLTPGSAQVLLGADDRHLQFRSCVSVMEDGERVIFSLSTRVLCLNPFGHLYMAAVDPLHRHFIAPKMLATAVSCLLLQAPAGACTAAGPQ